MSKSAWLIGAAVLIILLLVLWRPWQEQAIAVYLVTAETGPVEDSVANTRTGTIQACQRSKLSMPTGGTVARLLVDEGDNVIADQLLLELWNKDKKALVEQSQQHLLSLKEQEKSSCLTAQLRQREAQRQEQLLAKKLTSEERADAARTAAEAAQTACASSQFQCQMAEATLDLHRAQLELTQLRAPFAGVVAEIHGEVGEYITPSPPGIVTPAAVDLIDYSCLYVSAPIDEIDAARVAIGQPARVTLDAYRQAALAGTVTRIAPYVLDLEKQARTVDVDVTLESIPDNINLLVGYSADITVILAAQENTLRLPSEAILADGSVWRVNDANRLEKQPVSVGIGDWSYTEILDGLKPGDRVVQSPDLPGLEAGKLVIEQDD